MNLLAKHLHSLATTILHDMYSIDNKHAFGHYIFLYVETQKNTWFIKTSKNINDFSFGNKNLACDKNCF